MIIGVGAGVCLVVSLLLPPLLRPLLRRVGVMDVPNGRSSHTTPTLRGAGLAALLALAVTFGVVLLLVDPRVESGAILLVLLVSLAAGVLGLCEDVWGVPVAIRAAIQLALGLGGALAAASLFGLDWWWVALFAVGIAGYINVANFMDGINGISGLHGGVVGGALAVAGAFTGEVWLAVAGVVIAAAFVGFLPWNFVRSGMFLGDVGSYLLGASIAITMTVAFARGVPLLALVAPISIYLVDAGVTLLRRVLRGEKWYEAHRSHVYQQLTGGGRPHAPVAIVVAVFSALAAAAGLLSLAGPQGGLIGGALVIVVALVYLGLPRLVGTEAAEVVALPESELPRNAVMDGPLRWAVVGASGFIGSAVVRALEAEGADVVEVKAPRLRVEGGASVPELLALAEKSELATKELADQLRGVDVVVNAAGLATPDASDAAPLFGANALLPVVLLTAAGLAGAMRVIHLSSAAVQGRTPQLDETATFRPFSAYSRSKALGEMALFARVEDASDGRSPELVVLRATSVQGVGRETTRQLRRLARSPLSSVAAPGDRPTVVSSVDGLVSFIRFVGSHISSVPTVVLQPWEGMTTAEVLHAAGGRAPRMLPKPLCRFFVSSGFLLATIVRPLQGGVRRVELMWFGQEQDAAWARRVGAEGVSFVVEAFQHGQDKLE
ncbi:UDP-N-acetylmuramyl pentapeptide phosphotransferase/UDP-N-acetylglucosamine-1-phosphate transferase [Homoserinimonas aerilata]|uniref:UDP-N-acetylmuramyl pentapeptide phosphotransferase/UDP-N-acetylglucosamine-1-phosphate transferase n=1 Tax=Homoserinimonas aerilata TaxID=1162970 RepID=A0A542YKP9_9MICO|nr:NAD-dependent epimerase/dehydratase family protein [Homoserinimonas aerilata]TQL48631.1 UDP-N-acetylmuramyl pentapeptide phosphotransferase/UDP-N-acetylglucosamine-1-phosphate transferase [Homoserinimonas aerilata]